MKLLIFLLFIKFIYCDIKCIDNCLYCNNTEKCIKCEDDFFGDLCKFNCYGYYLDCANGTCIKNNILFSFEIIYNHTCTYYCENNNKIISCTPSVCKNSYVKTFNYKYINGRYFLNDKYPCLDNITTTTPTTTTTTTKALNNFINITLPYSSKPVINTAVYSIVFIPLFLIFLFLLFIMCVVVIYVIKTKKSYYNYNKLNSYDLDI